MITAEENALLTGTDPGTPMGETLRRYWIPALLSSEIPDPDCPPVRVSLLGEKLIAFRDTQGRIGLMEELCAHRRTSLFLGRNEECGLRCVFHGWKYDVNGNCVDMMNEPPETRYKDEIKLVAYPTVEMGGVIWAYMGPSDRMPPHPSFEWANVPEEQSGVSKSWQQCNWLQGLEGGVDTAHVPILHRVLKADSNRSGYKPTSTFAKAGAPVVELDVTEYGFRYAGIRPLGESESFIRTYHYVMPFHQIRPGENTVTPFNVGHMWVPMDDHNCMVYNWGVSINGDPLDEWDQIEENLGRAPGDQLSDFSNVRNIDNQWLIDRQVQKTETFTGIEGVNNQDQAVQESMGPIVDRTKEYLTPSDLSIVHLRKLLIQAAGTVADGGDPPGVGTSYVGLRAIDRVLPRGEPWRDSMLKDMYQG